MTKYIALLRGINVGGQKKILMADLRALLASAGFGDVQTYIQSGNVIFSSSEGIDFQQKISEVIQNNYGFDVTVLVKTVDQIEAILSKCPFSEEKKEKSYFTLFHQTPTSIHLSELDLSGYPDEECYLTPQCVYSYYHKGAGKAKCHNNFFERKLEVKATTRNYKTMTKLVALVSS